MSPADLAPPSVSVTVVCAGCARSRRDADGWRSQVQRLTEQLDAERRHGAELEARVLRHLPTWERP